MSVIETGNIYKDPIISKNSLTVLERRYLKKDADGNLTETPKDMFLRVSENISDAEVAFGSSSDVKEKYKKVFYDLMTSFEFLPNSPTLMNAGGKLQQLSACFVLPVDDSMESIFDAIKNTALIHKSGGGTGFSFSNLRPKNDIVGSTKGVSSGPISFMSVFDTATETVKQGGTRRGANMGILRVDHPDILDFITCKKDTDKLNNFNISVAITDDFMEAYEKGGEYELINPHTKEVAGKLNAEDVFNLIVKQAWENGEPGIVFIDRINAKNPTPLLGDISSTNPCGEQPLLPFEACNLGSINLNKVLALHNDEYKIDYEKLDRIVVDSIRFLDNVIEKSKFPLDEITELVRGNRKVGLGVMGFADLLYKLAIPYNSDDAIRIAKDLMMRINDVAYKASEELAKERGAFPNIDKSIYKGSLVRNATRTTIAPTGTISIISSVSSGVEPVFGLVYFRNVMDNTKLVEVHPYFEEVAKKRGFYSEELMEEIAQKGSLKDIEGIPDDVKEVFVISHDVEPEAHVKIQAAFQEYTDNAVSKTINFPNAAAEEDVAKSYLLAYSLGCKGITIYRDGSRDNQVLNLGKDKKEEDARGVSEDDIKAIVEKELKPRKRPDITTGATIKVQTGCGNLYVTINSDENGLCEVFASMGKSGGCASSQIEATTRLISLALRSRVSPEAILRQIKGIRCPHPTGGLQEGGAILSCADGIARALAKYLSVENGRNMIKDGKLSTTEVAGMCPECGGVLDHDSGCLLCRGCGFSKCG